MSRISRQLLAAAALVPCMGSMAWAVPPSCTASATGIMFGVYNPSNPAVAFTGSIRILCSGGAATFTIALSSGSSGSTTARQMRSGSAALNYQIYTNAAHTTVWGDGTVGSTVGPITATAAVVTAYGLLFANQKVPPGTYTDAIQAIVTY